MTEEIQESNVIKTDNITPTMISEEMRRSYLDYAMSVIVSRALPDARDGMKPVHRRIIYGMYENGYDSTKPYRKSARIVGDVMGKYHPHGDSSIYEAMVRMAQPFSMRVTLVDGQGNFGSMDGDGAAAMRYTESRLSKISLELLRNINKNTVDFSPNFDESEREPVVLPSRFPNILVNGTTGIAVGMATNIPPHNLSEVIDGCVAYIDNQDIDTLELMQYIKGPDFPTGGIILGNSGIKKAYETGRGSITIRSKATIEEEKGHQVIIIDEIPYGVNSMDLKNKVAELVHNKTIEGISDYHTDLKDGIKITITLKKDANAQVVLNKLYKHTSFQTSYGIIFLMLDQGVPKTLGLKDIIAKYIDFQREIIIRRTKYDLDVAEKRVHILEGLKIALDNIDEVVKLIRAAKSDEEAREGLMTKFSLSEIQANAILEMKLRRLTGLEREKIDNELKELAETIAYLKEILSSDEKVLGVIKEELLEIKDRYGDERRTFIDMTAIEYIDDESLIPNDDIIVTLTNKGYIKRLNNDTYRTQNRGGVGIKGMSTNEEDFVEHMLNLDSHDYLLFFSNKGKVYRIKGYEVPEFSRQSKGLPIVNLLPLEKDENISSILSGNKDDGTTHFVFVTKNGLCKRTELSQFENIRKSGKIAISLKDDDELISVKASCGKNEIMIGASNGRMVRFDENEVRSMGRNSSGVKGIDMDGAQVVSSDVLNDDDMILIVTDNGYGKLTNISEYRKTHRGSKGVKALNVTEKNGNLNKIRKVDDLDNSSLVIVTDSGIIIKIPLSQISILKRNTQGTRLINLKDDQKVSTVAVVSNDLDDNNEENEEVK